MSLRHKEDSISLIRDKESINSKDRVKIIPYGEEPPLGETDVNRPCLFMCIKEVDAEGQPTAIEFRDCHGHVYPASSPELLKYLSGAPLNYSGTPVSIAYAGTNRIASITAYGENAQGGTTEAPVALTGVDSVHVCGRNLLPLPYSQVSETKNGLNIAVNADGTITVSGTATAETYLNLKPIPASLYRLMGVTGITPAYDYPVTKNGFTFFDLTIQPHVEFALVYIVITKGSVVNRTYRPYIIKSAEPLPYETYQGSVTPLPIPRALHEVGDVRDVCRTRVKSVWDKSVQVDITQLKKNSASPYQYYINVESNSVNIAVKPAASTLSYNLTTGIQPFKSGINFWMNGLLEVDDLEHAKAWFTEHPTKVFYQSTAYNGTNGLDVCLTEYQTGFVELDGTEGIEYQSAYNRFAYTLPSTAVNDSGFCSHYKKLMTSAPGEDKYIVIRPEAVYFYDSQYTNADAFNAYLAAQKAAGTPVQIVYQLATPETYATDPVDFDNTAGPLTVLTGGELEVRMTELVGSRTYDADGDGVVDEAEKVSNALTLKNAAGEVVATFDGSEAAILQLTAALVGALGKTEKAADSSKLAGLTPIIDNPSSTNNRNTWYFPFTGTNNKDGTRKYYAALYADEATRAANKVGGGALVDTNDGRLSNARRASNITMGYDGNLWISYS